jgi:hypothetical protein
MNYFEALKKALINEKLNDFKALLAKTRKALFYRVLYIHKILILEQEMFEAL